MVSVGEGAQRADNVLTVWKCVSREFESGERVGHVKRVERAR